MCDETVTLIPPADLAGYTSTYTITPKAAERIRGVITGANAEAGADDFVLRLLVESGGCAGYSYRLSVVRASDLDSDDERFIEDGFQLAVPGLAVPLIDGLTIDFVETLTQAGFTFQNSKATGSCGCGESFSPSADAEQAVADRMLSAEVIDVLGDIRPYLQGEGGDVSLIGVRDSVVSVQLEGACGGCSMATMTLKNVIERRLKEAIPSIREVVAV